MSSKSALHKVKAVPTKQVIELVHPGKRQDPVGEKEYALLDEILQGNAEMVEAWVEDSPIDLTVVDRQTRNTFLHYAAQVGNPDSIRHLLKKMPELVIKRNKRKQTSALLAAQRQNWKACDAIRKVEERSFSHIRFDRMKDSTGRSIQYYVKKARRKK